VGDHLDPRDELHGVEKLLLPEGVGVVPPGFLEDVEGAGGEGLVGPKELTAVRRRGDDEDRSRAVGHDVLRRREPGHDGHHHVEGHDVGAQDLAELDRPLAVLGRPHDLDVGIACEQLAETGPHRRRVLDHEHPDALHRRSTSPRMRPRRSTWSNSLFTT
jgi:hypothetical protein